MRVGIALLVVLGFLMVGCQAGSSAEDLAGTYVASTQVFVAAVEEAVSTGIAATLTAEPTATRTATPTVTASLTVTPSATPEPTMTSTERPSPTVTGTPEPTATGTPSAADIKAGQLLSALRNMKTLGDRLYSGLGGTGTGYLACSHELSDSVVVNLDTIRKLPTFDDALFSSRMIGANINYRLAREAVLDSTDIQIAYTNCVNWLAAGKPEGGPTASDEGANMDTARAAARQAVSLAEAGLNN